MKIIIDKSKLLKPLSHIQSVVERKNTIPILSNVIISANDDKLSLSATDMDIDILEKINCNVINSGSVTVTAHILYDIVRKLTDGSEVEIEYNDGTASLTSNKSKFQLPVLPVEDYPTLSKGDFPISFKLTVGELSRLIDKTKFAISNDSGVSHMLSTNHCLLIKLFGPKDSQKFTPNMDNLITITASEINSDRIEDIQTSRVIYTIENMKVIDV